MKRTALKATFLLLLATFVAGVCVVFSKALGPTQKPSEAAMHVQTSEMPVGGLMVVEWNRQHVIIIRGKTAFSVFAVPFQKLQNEDMWGLPDLTWARPTMLCKHFALPVNPAGLIEPTGTFECQDSNKGDWYRNSARWRVDGENISGKLEPLPVPQFVVESGNVVLGKVGR